MRVLHVITSLRRGGAERLLVDLAPRLIAGGCDVHVLSITSTIPLAQRLHEQAIDVRSLGYNGTIYQSASLLRAILATRREIERLRPAIVHSHLYLADLVTRLASPKGARLVTTLHNEDQWWQQRMRLRSLAKTWADAKTAAIRSTRAIAVSEAVAGAAMRALGMSRSILRVVHNGIDERCFEVSERRWHAEPIVIQVGRFHAQKGHTTALKAFSELLRTHPGARLQLVGEGPEEPGIRDMAASMGIAQRVDFVGSRADIPELLARAHVFWMPSEWEGLGLACMEAMATGLPVVASRVGGIPEFVSEDTGYLITAGDAAGLAAVTREIFENYARALQRANRGAQFIRENHTVTKTARAYVSAYDDLINGAW